MAARQDIDIDQVVNYEAEYSRYIKNHKKHDGQITGACPFHDDKKDSFSANTKTGQWYCFAEGRGGNFISFMAELNGMSEKEAYKKILPELCIFPG